MDQSLAHELVSVLKQLASELGKTPTKWEFTRAVVGGDRKISKAFGTYSALVLAAGLPSYNDRRAKGIDEYELRGKSVEDAIAENELIPSSRPVIHSGDFAPILAVGDIHFPWSHQKTLEKIYRFAEREKPGYIVQLGDLFDMFAFASFPRSMNLYTPDQELNTARGMAVEFWSEIKKSSSASQCYQIKGNHSLRPMKRVLESAPALESLVAKSLDPLFQFDGVTTIGDYREVLSIQGIDVHHGYLNQLGGHRDAFQNNAIVGHSHLGGCVFKVTKQRIIWELNAGYVGDDSAKCFGYTPTKTTKWTLGWGFVDEYGPRFIPG